MFQYMFQILKTVIYPSTVQNKFYIYTNINLTEGSTLFQKHIQIHNKNKITIIIIIINAT